MSLKHEILMVSGSGRPEPTESVKGLPDVRRKLRTLADPESAASHQRFFKTGPGQYGEGDRFLGIRVPQIRALIRPSRDLSEEAVLELLRSQWHEERLLALFLLVDRYGRGRPAERATIHDVYIANTEYINNWDLVDSSAEHIVGAHLDPNHLELIEQLAQSESVWERRIAMLATFHWIKRGVFQPALAIAELLVHDSHDLIHKAVGWMLREVGQRNQAEEERFLRKHARLMPRTMLRYAIERFPEEKRQSYLMGIARQDRPLRRRS